MHCRITTRSLGRYADGIHGRYKVTNAGPLGKHHEPLAAFLHFKIGLGGYHRAAGLGKGPRLEIRSMPPNPDAQIPMGDGHTRDLHIAPHDHGACPLVHNDPGTVIRDDFHTLDERDKIHDPVL